MRYGGNRLKREFDISSPVHRDVSARLRQAPHISASLNERVVNVEIYRWELFSITRNFAVCAWYEYVSHYRREEYKYRV